MVAIALSASFREPLESRGIHLSQVGIELLLKYFPSGRNVDSLRDHYNQRMASIYDEIRDLVQIALSAQSTHGHRILDYCARSGDLR